jgi:hypothetical protein
MAAYTDILNANSKQMTSVQRRQIGALIDGPIAIYKAVYPVAIAKQARIEAATKKMEIWLPEFEGLKGLTSKYIKWFKMGVKIATSAALGLGNLGGEMGNLTTELADKTAALAQSIHDNATAAVIQGLQDGVMEKSAEIASTELKMMGEAVTTIIAEGLLTPLMEKLADVKF